MTESGDRSEARMTGGRPVQDATRKRYTLEHHAGVTTLRILRDLNLKGILEVVDDVADADQCNRRLWDLTKVFHYSPDEIRQIAERRRIRWPSPSRVAYVASDALAYGLLRMFEVYREQKGYETAVFKSVSEARAWFDETP